ncbi:MAG: ABC transporter substrate-binding protein [Nocardioides sp.]|uniref:ABC transporter substrate-binding protein n=1 Tax=Nocardioides sp. TaxID=35761 RepID=UPI0039E62FDA
MKVLRTLIVVLAAALALVLTACGGVNDVGTIPDQPVRGGVLEYGTDVQPVSGGLDPYVTTAFASQNILVQIYESLLTKDDKGRLKPGLATRWKKTGPLSYRFYLRHAEFSNGTALTATDVVFSFDTMKKAGASQAAMLTALKSVRAVNDHTVDFQLSAPSTSFLNLVAGEANGLIVSKAWYTSTPAAQRQRQALGTGPFMLTQWQDNVVIKLRRNPHYWHSPLPYLDGIDFKIIPDDQARLAALRQGSVDAIWLGDQQLAEQVSSEGFVTGKNAETRNLSLYVNATTGAMANLDFRRALSEGLNRPQIAKLASYGYGTTSLVVPRGDPAGLAPTKNTPYYTYDPSDARRLLARSGVTDPTVTIHYPSDASFARDVALYEVMQEQLKAVGIKVVLDPTPWAEILADYIKGSWDGLIAVPGTAQPDPTAYFNAFLVPGQPTNKSGKAGTRAAALLQQLRQTTSAKRQPVVLRRLENEVADKVLVIVPYVVAQRQEIWSRRLQGYQVDPYSFRRNLKKAWLVP